MQALSASQLVELWDLSVDQRPTERALTVLSYGYPELGRERFAGMPLGQRDGHLLRLHQHNFGAALQCYAACPSCTTPLEFDLAIDELCQRDSAAAGREARLLPEEPESRGAGELSFGEYQLRFHVPTSADLLAVQGLASRQPDRALQQLLSRCLVSVEREGQQVSPDELSEAVIDALSGRMAELDPLSEVRLDLHCPECQSGWPLLLDVVTFFFKELDVRVQRLLAEVHVLAQAYGWSEAQVLSLSTRKRQLYLRLVRG